LFSVAVNAPTAGVPVDEGLNILARKNRFLNFLKNSTSNFSQYSDALLDKLINLVIENRYEAYKECGSADRAVELCRSVEYSITIRTLKLWNERGVTLVGKINTFTGYANEINYYQIVYKGRHCIFKTSLHGATLASILKDVAFTLLVEKRSEMTSQALGLVSYELLEVNRVRYEGGVDRGSVAVQYPSTAESLVGKNINNEIFMKIYNSVYNSMIRVHSFGLLIGDIRPSNIFMDMQGNPFIGDFGGFVDMKAVPLAPLTEYTAKYLPKELHKAIPTFMMDKCCFVATMLDIFGISFGELNKVEDLYAIVNNLNCEDIKQWLLFALK
jgi:hypothetical protein